MCDVNTEQQRKSELKSLIVNHGFFYFAEVFSLVLCSVSHSDAAGVAGAVDGRGSCLARLEQSCFHVSLRLTMFLGVVFWLN